MAESAYPARPAHPVFPAVPLPRLSLPRRVTGPAVAAVAGVAAAATLYLRDPHQSGSYGFCPFRAATGLPCPFCGGLRATNDLLHGQALAALQSNALAVAVLLVGAGVWAGWTVRRVGGDGREDLPLRLGRRTGVAVLAVVVVFGVLRWFPQFSFLRPT